MGCGVRAASDLASGACAPDAAHTSAASAGPRAGVELGAQEARHERATRAAAVAASHRRVTRRDSCRTLRGYERRRSGTPPSSRRKRLMRFGPAL